MPVLNKKQLLAILAPTSTLIGGVVSADTEINNSRSDETTGHLDVFVDHSYLDETIQKASSKGVEIVREDTEILEGDGEETRKNIAKTKEYYLAKQKELITAMDNYERDVNKRNKKMKQSAEAANNANGVMNSLVSNLSVYGRTTVSEGVTYNDTDYATHRSNVEDAVKLGKKYNDIKNEINDYNRLQNSYVLFQTQASQGNIKLRHETITVSNVGELTSKVDELKQSYANLETYVNGLSSQTGSVADADKPTYTLYDVVIDSTLTSEFNKPVTVYQYSGENLPEIEKPVVSYKYYDLRSTPRSDSKIDNKDDEIIELQANGSLKHIQVLKNQTIKLKINNEKLPEGRFDKVHNIISTVALPDGVEVNKDTLLSNDYWKIDYNEDNQTITYSATPKYLVEVNRKQNVNNGTLSGSMKDEFKYEIPTIEFKVVEDNKDVTLNFETIINNEYLVSNHSVMIKTTSPNPEKHNYDEDAVIVDGKALLPGSKNNYELTMDFDQYKGINIDKEMQEHGFHIYDVAPFEALDFNGKIMIKDGSNVIATATANGGFVDNDNKVITGLTWSKVDKVDGININKPAIKVSIQGYEHPYYKEYMEKGKSLKVNMEFTTKVVKNSEGGYGKNTYSNVFYQDDFGNIYKSNEVVNTVPKIDPRKDAVISRSNLTSLDLKANEKATIEEGIHFQYRAKGTELPSNVRLKSYTITDTFHEADDYDGVYFVESGNEIHFKQGTALYERYKRSGGVMSANTDITKYTTQKIDRNVSSGVNTDTGITSGMDTKITKVTIDFDNDFIESIDFEKTKFQVDAFLQAKRNSETQGVTNVFKEVINGLEFDSTTVTTNTSMNMTKLFDNKFKDLLDKFNKDKEEQANRDADQDKRINQNTLLIRHLANRVQKVEGTQQLHSEAINSLIKKVRGLEDNSKYSTIVIYKPTVVSETDAVNYVINRGIAPQAIKKVELNSDNNFVVTYRNNEGELTEQAINSKKVEKVRVKYEFYNMNTTSEVEKKLYDLGYVNNKISIEKEGNKFVAVVYTVTKETVVKDSKLILPKVPQPKEMKLGNLFVRNLAKKII